jgi:hypothetical protein
MAEINSEGFGKIPNASANFGTIPQGAEGFGTVRNNVEKTEHHTLTVREVARMFENADVPRTERSIINWCQPNRQGIARLDAFFDTNERKYFITPQSVSLAIREEQAKGGGNAAVTPPPMKEKIPNPSENNSRPDTGGSERADELTRQNRDLEIATRAKDYYIERLEKERGQYVEKLVGMSRYVGELESQLLQLGGAPRGDKSLPQSSETIVETML